jgi:hypothetical protein
MRQDLACDFPQASCSRQNQAVSVRNKSSAPETSHPRRKQVIRAGNKSFAPETSHSRRKQVIRAGNKFQFRNDPEKQPVMKRHGPVENFSGLFSSG